MEADVDMMMWCVGSRKDENGEGGRAEMDMDENKMHRRMRAEQNQKLQQRRPETIYELLQKTLHVKEKEHVKQQPG
jgi:hypothetical protein